MDEELRRTKRDFQRQLNDKDKSLEEIKNEKESVEKALAAERSEASKTDSSASVKRNYYNDVNFYVVERHLGVCLFLNLLSLSRHMRDGKPLVCALTGTPTSKD